MAQLQVSRPADSLASLRIDRTKRQRTGSRAWTLLWVLLVLGAAGGAGYYGYQQFGGTLFMTTVKAATVAVREAGTQDSVLNATGYLKSRRQAAIGAKAPGRVFKVYVEEGKFVTKDAPIAELEHADVDASVAAMEASLSAMSASLDKSKHELKEMETSFGQDELDFGRTDQLFRNRGASATEYERAQSKLEGSRNRLNSMKAAVTLAERRLVESEQRLLEAKEQRQNMFILAPFDGNVITKDAEPGETITPGGLGAASGRGSVVTLADLQHLEVDTDVKEDYIGRVSKGQEATIEVDAVKDRRFKGEVRTVIPMGDRARGTVKVKVTISEDELAEVNPKGDAPPLLFPEMSATVRFMPKDHQAQSGDVIKHIYAPAAAVKKDGDNQFVWLISDGRVKRVTVETGDKVGSDYVIQSGLKGGELVVLDPADSLKPDTAVKVAQ